MFCISAAVRISGMLSFPKPASQQEELRHCLEAQIYMFGHRDATAALPVIELSVHQHVSGHDTTLSLSALHFVPVASNSTAPAISTYAQNVQLGNVVTTIFGGKLAVGTVVAKRTAMTQGAFNPYTKVRVQSMHQWTAARGEEQIEA